MITVSATGLPSTHASLCAWLAVGEAMPRFTAKRGGIVFSTPQVESGDHNRSGLD